MNKWKIGLASIFVGAALLMGVFGNTADAAETKVFNNAENHFSLTIPSDWNNQKNKEMDILTSVDRKMAIIALCQAVPRDDSYGTYMLDEVSAAERATIMEEMKKGFLQTAAPGMSITQSEYVKLANGHNAIIMMIEGSATGPMIGMTIIRGEEAILLVGTTDSAAEFNKSSKALAGIMGTLTVE